MKTFKPQGAELVEEATHAICPACSGDGKETCNNPDHGFINAVGGELARLGCPVCGYDPKHKVKNGGDCEGCNGKGEILLSEFGNIAYWCGFEDDPTPIALTRYAINPEDWKGITQVKEGEFEVVNTNERQPDASYKLVSVAIPKREEENPGFYLRKWIIDNEPTAGALLTHILEHYNLTKK